MFRTSQLGAEQMEDEEMIRRLQSGKDETAARAFMNKYMRWVFAIAYRIVSDVHNAEDVVQEVFEKVLITAIHSVEPCRPLRPFLLVVTRRVAIDHLRRQKPRSIQAKNLDSVVEQVENLPDNGPKHEELVETAELISKIPAYLNELPVNLRDVLQLRLDGNSFEEIASLLKIPFGTVASRYAR